VESSAFLSMVAHGEQTLLCEIQAVEAGYPLRAGSRSTMTACVLRGHSARGTVWWTGACCAVWICVLETMSVSVRSASRGGAYRARHRPGGRFLQHCAACADERRRSGRDGLLQEGSRITYR